MDNLMSAKESLAKIDSFRATFPILAEVLSRPVPGNNAQLVFERDSAIRAASLTQHVYQGACRDDKAMKETGKPADALRYNDYFLLNNSKINLKDDVSKYVTAIGAQGATAAETKRLGECVDFSKAMTKKVNDHKSKTGDTWPTGREASTDNNHAKSGHLAEVDSSFKAAPLAGGQTTPALIRT